MKTLYKIPIPEAAQVAESDSRQAKLAELGVLDSSAVVEQISTGSADLTLEGQWRFGEYLSELFAQELEEIAEASVGALPLFREGSRYSSAGYYEIQDATVQPAHANQRGVWQYELSLSKKGTRNTFWRAVRPNPRGPVEHEFGNSLSPIEVAIPDAASKAQWYNTDDGTRTTAEPTETRTGEFGDLAVYDLTDAPWYDADPFDEDVPVLLYDVAYADDSGAFDTRLYDTLGQSEKYLESDDPEDDRRIRLWESVWDTSHDPSEDGALVLDNGLLRLWIDEGAGTLDAQTWDAAAGTWTDTGLADDQPASVELFDADVETIQMLRDVVQLTVDVDGDLFALDAILQAGADAVLFDVPAGETPPIPTALEEWLAPIAAETLVDPQAEKGLVARREVRR